MKIFEDFQAFNGWFESWAAHHGIRSLKYSGDKLSAPTSFDDLTGIRVDDDEELELSIPLQLPQGIPDLDISLDLSGNVYETQTDIVQARNALKMLHGLELFYQNQENGAENEKNN